MRKRRGSLAKLGTIFLAVFAALALSGMGYGIWTDTLTLSGTLEMGTYEVEVIAGTPDSDVTCSIVVDTLDFTLDITIDTEGTGLYQYKSFGIHNIGTVPLRIQNIQISSPGVTTTVSGISVNNVIDGGATLYGTVNMQVTVAGTYNVQVTINTIPWNQ